jgi:hypothetical protein
VAVEVTTQTVELPLTPAHVEALRHHIAWERRWFLGLIAASATFGAFMPLVPRAGQDGRVLEGLMLAGFIFAFGLVLDWFVWRRPFAAAIRQGTYSRTTGPIRITEFHDSGWVSVGKVTITRVATRIGSELRNLPWGTIDYAPRTRLVVEQRDADGELLYRYPGYRPDADKFDVRPIPSVFMGILCGIGSCTVIMLIAFGFIAWFVAQR